MVKGNYHNVSEHFITLIMGDLIEWYPISRCIFCIDCCGTTECVFVCVYGRVCVCVLWSGKLPILVKISRSMLAFNLKREYRKAAKH